MSPAWYLVGKNDQKIPRYVEVEELYKKTGVKYIKISNEEQVQKLKNERGFQYENILELSEASPNYEEEITPYRTEHVHADQEMRYFLDGSGYFDVRDKDDQWIRIVVGREALIILPAGVYHRFSLGDKKYIKVRQFFSNKTGCKTYFRSAVLEPNQENIDDINQSST